MFSPTNLLMLIILLTSILMTLFSNSWFSAWLGLEINTLSFIAMMSYHSQESSESLMMYFLPQALASAIFLLFSLIPMTFSKSLSHPPLINSLILISLSLKLGAAPLHLWFPKVAKNLPWSYNSLLMTTQKIQPMFLISLIETPPLMFFIIMSSAIIGSLGGLSQTNMKTILSFSSISHMSWMLSSMFINSNIWMMYLFTYSVILLSLISIMSSSKSSTINQLNHTYNLTMIKLSIILLLLSLGGMPPLLGFFPKWIIISNLNSNSILIILILSALINLFFYLRISYSMLLQNPPLNLLNSSLSLNISYSIISTTSILSFPIMVFPFLFLSNP